MNAMTKTAGYPVHAVAEFKQWENQHGALFTDWRAVCGESGTNAGHGPFGLAGSARRMELCSTCFLGRLHSSAHHPEPVEVSR